MKIIYIRTSTTEQTPEIQLRDIQSMIDLDECTCFKEQESAYKSESTRPEFEKLKNLITKNMVSDVFVWHIDRLSRNRKKLYEFFWLCKTYSVKIHSYKQNWLNTLNSIPEPFNEIVYDLMLQIFGFIAEEESATKSARVRNAIRKSPGGKTKSYKGNTWGRKPISKQAIAKIIEMRKQGRSIREIAGSVQIYDSNNNGRNISKSTVHKILAEFGQEKHSISA